MPIALEPGLDRGGDEGFEQRLGLHQPRFAGLGTRTSSTSSCLQRAAVMRSAIGWKDWPVLMVSARPAG